jgi:NSS family neurotransmitter:Na+ symporter
MTTRRRNLWGTKFGFYLVAVGSAFGLGNLWRFPYITVRNGGGAFVLLYVLFAVIIGLPLLIGELMIGKIARHSAILASQRLGVDAEIAVSGRSRSIHGASPWVWVGRFSLISCLLVLSYYAVISGWVLHFLVQFSVAIFKPETFDIENSLHILRDNGLLQIALTSVHLLLTLIVVVKGVQEGIEKWVGHMMPIFVILLLLLVTKSLSQPTAGDALRFLFYPDFSKLKYSSMLSALGHVFFTLSIGFGSMITFGSYLTEQTRIPVAGLRVTVMDTVISLFAGLLIFPLLIGTNFSASGPELLFQTLPRLLLDLDSGFFFGMTFFICLYLAALGASIGLLESLVANLLDFTSLTRSQAAWVVGGAAFLIGVLPALSTTLLSSVQMNGRGLLEIMDGVLINGLLPIAALGVSVAVAVRLKPERVKAEFLNDDSQATRQLHSHWVFIVRWLVPGAILVAFALAIAGAVLGK